jgi:putative phosphoesterase
VDSVAEHRLLVLSDTHLAAGQSDRLPAAVWDALQRATAVIHAGDVVDADLLERLAQEVPVHAVLGNNDHGLEGRLPERLELEIGGLRLAAVHDSGARVGRAGRLRRWFPRADVVIFGHSHQPVNELGEGGQRLFNPGSPTQRRRAPVATYGWITISPRGAQARILATDGSRVVSASPVR